MYSLQKASQLAGTPHETKKNSAHKAVSYSSRAGRPPMRAPTKLRSIGAAMNLATSSPTFILNAVVHIRQSTSKAPHPPTPTPRTYPISERWHYILRINSTTLNSKTLKSTPIITPPRGLLPTPPPKHPPKRLATRNFVTKRLATKRFATRCLATKRQFHRIAQRPSSLAALLARG